MKPGTIGGAVRDHIGDAFDRSFWVFAGLAAVSGTACWFLVGKQAFYDSLVGDLWLLLSVLPKLIAAMLLAAFIQVLLPREWVARWIGEQSGLKGFAIAAGAGALTPGGPMTSFPLVSALHAAGSGRGTLIAYLTSWATLGLQRILVWEVPLMGFEFACIRWIASLPLPFIAAGIARFIPRGKSDPRSAQ
jgi:uncharacterized membrane protein YraQ (UPF0718 family)